jgi:hypothetical protein
MHPILLIGAAAVAFVAVAVAFAWRARRHKIVAPTLPPERLRVVTRPQTVNREETSPAAFERQRTQKDEKSRVQGPPTGLAELIQPPAFEVLIAPIGSDEVKTVGLQETEWTVQAPAPSESTNSGESQMGVKAPGQNEAAAGIGDTGDGLSSPLGNCLSKEAQASGVITEDSVEPKVGPGDASTEMSSATVALFDDTEHVRRIEPSTGSLGAADAEAASADSTGEREAEATGPLRIEEAAKREGNGRDEDRTKAQKTARSSRQYRPAVRTLPKPDVRTVETEERLQRARAFSLEVRLVFEPGGFCRVSLLPQRAEDLPEELLVSGVECEVELAALQEDWYQDVSLADTGRLLRRGIEWQAALPEDRTVRWSLSGREIYVLAPHDHLSGFVSAPRLVLGEQHVVLCAAERRADVLRAIERTGSPEPQVIAEADGTPAGWMGFRGVIPRKPVAPSLAGDILDALCPLPDTEIVLKGGIRIGRSTWLEKYPPVIQVHGDDSLVELTIDGHEARKGESGAYTNQGWDLRGDHVIWTASTSRSYSISAGLESWDPWDAYGWSWGESSVEGDRKQPAICGVIVRSPRIAAPGTRAKVQSGSNPIFIGAGVGEIEVCRTPAGVRTNVAIGFPPFDPVWAAPADALHSDKSVARVVLVGSPRVPEGTNFAPARGSTSNTRHARRELALRARAWCTVILDAGRKGLQPEPNTEEVSALWKQYRRTAKLVWRALR